MQNKQRFQFGVLALVVGALTAPAVSQAQRPPRSSDSSPSSPPTSSSSSGSYGSGASYSSGSSSSSSSSSYDSGSSYSSGSSSSSSSSSSYSSGSSYSGGSSYDSGSSYSGGSSSSSGSRSRPSRSVDTTPERERPGYVRDVPPRTNSSSGSSSTTDSSTSGSGVSSSTGSSASGSTAVGRPARTGASTTAGSATTPAVRPSRDATGIVPSNPNAAADPRVERNRIREAKPQPGATPVDGATPSVSTEKPRTVRASSKVAAVRQRVYRTPENTTRNVRGQYVSATHDRRLDVAREQGLKVRAHRGSRKFIERREKAYRQSARPDAYRRFGEHRELWRARPARWSRWYDFGLYGGYYWDLGEYYEVEEFFYNPVIGYYVDGEWHEDIYEKWFEIKDGKRILYKRPFAYPGVPLPTQALIELLMSVSAMDLYTQEKFRYGFERIIQLLQSDLMKLYGQEFKLGKHDLVISHFRLLDGKGVILEGTVGKGLEQFPFKAVMEFDRPLAALVFVAIDENPSARPELVERLNVVNQAIDKLVNGDLEDELMVPLEYGLEEQK